MTRPVIGHSSLRCFDTNRVRTIAAGGGPQFGNDELHVYCSLCDCQLSGDAFEANGVDEWCDNHDCWCHSDTWMPQDELPMERTGE